MQLDQNDGFSTYSQLFGSSTFLLLTLYNHLIEAQKVGVQMRTLAHWAPPLLVHASKIVHFILAVCKF